MPNSERKPAAVKSLEVPIRAKATTYPSPFAPLFQKREKRQLGEFFGLKNFGVNLTHLYPGGCSSLYHKHSKQDEMIYVLEGEATLVTESGETRLSAGMCAGFAAAGAAHQLVNKTDTVVIYLEIGDRSMGDDVTYPNDDIKAYQDSNGQWQYTRKDGTPY